MSINVNHSKGVLLHKEEIAPQSQLVAVSKRRTGKRKREKKEEVARCFVAAWPLIKHGVTVKYSDTKSNLFPQMK